MTETEEREYYEYLKLKAKAGGSMVHTNGRWANAPIVQPEPDPMRPEVSGGQALGRGAVQGATLSFGDEINGLIQALGEKYLPESLGGGGEQAKRRGLGALYRQNRDTFRRENDDASTQHKKTYIAGNVLGGLATAPLMPGGSVKTLGAAVRSGATLGAIAGLGGSHADLTDGITASEIGEVGTDTALGGLFGAGGGALGYGVGRAAPLMLRGARRLGESTAAKYGRRALLAGADSLSTRREVPAEVVHEAIRSGGVLPFGTTRGAAARLADRADAAGAAYGELIERLEAAGVPGPEVNAVAQRLLAEARDIGPNTLNRQLPRTFLDARRQIRAKAPGENLGLVQSERLKQSAQEAARYGRIEETPVNEARRRVAAILREANEGAIEQAGAANPGTEIAEMAENFVPVKRLTGRLIEARNAAERGAARASQRSQVGLKDVMLGTATGGSAPAAAGTAYLSSLVRERLPSTIASGAYWSSRGAGALANALQRSTNRGVVGGALGASSERAMAEDLFRLLGIEDDPRAQAALLQSLGDAP